MKGFFYKLTYSHKHRRAHLYNFGCNFRCRGCFYRISPPRPQRRLSLSEIEAALASLREKGASRLHLLGGEPTVNPELQEVIQLARSLGFRVVLITNGSNRVPEGVDRISVSIKAMSDEVHRAYTGRPVRPVLENVRDAYERGIDVHASTVLIPGLVDVDEVERIAAFLASLDELIPFYIIGFMPPPGSPWRKPTDEEVEAAARAARRHLKYVATSNPRPETIRHESEVILR